jgi:Reverse transcriptase (RNA-dependent DNA polymerase)
MELLKNYGVVPNTCRIISKIWSEDTMTPKQNKYFGLERGVRQGDIVSPTIFNIILYLVIQASEEDMKEEEKTTIVFYVDHGFIGGFNHVVQQTFELFVKKFKRFGLNMNVEKTKTITLLGSKPVHRVSKDAYNQRIPKIGLTCQEKQQMIIQCEFCKEKVQKKSL